MPTFFYWLQHEWRDELELLHWKINHCIAQHKSLGLPGSEQNTANIRLSACPRHMLCFILQQNVQISTENILVLLYSKRRVDVA